MSVARRNLTVFSVLALVASLHTPGLAQETDFGASSLSPDSSESVGKEARVAEVAGQELVSVIVKLEAESLADYDGGVAGLAPTSPEVTGEARLDVDSSESRAYLAHLATQFERLEGAAKTTVPEARIVHRFDVVFAGASMLVPENQVAALSRLPGVEAVFMDELRQVTTEVSPEFIGADRLWRQLGGQDDAGEGVIVGVIDTGVWPEHPSFSDPDPSGNPYPAPPGHWSGECEPPNDDSDPVVCNNKLIGARAFIDTYRALIGLLPGEFDSPRDDNGHGTHTSSTAAGNGNVEASIFGVPRGTVSGIAPRAHVAMYKACLNLGCFTSDLTAAIQQSVADGVDVINYSISGGDPYSDTASLAFLDAYTAGVFVSVSAGNSGPGADTVGHTEPWTAVVGASTTDRHFLSDVTLVADNGDTLQLTGASVTDGIADSTPVVLASDFTDGLCLEPFPAGTFNGEIVICERGIIARVEKSFNVAQGGASGLLLYNPSLQGLATDNHFIPSVHLEVDAGTQLLDFMATHTGVMGTFTPGEARMVQGDVMAAFSSRGGPGQTLGISKPDVTAPGVQILAGNTPVPATVVGGLPGELFQAIQGTSMSAPHVTGAGALLADLRPDWTPSQIRSALMMSAKTEGVFKEDGVTPADAFDYGSGRIDLSRAGQVGLTMDEDASTYVSMKDELWSANYPSVYVPVMPGRVTVSRTVQNEFGARITNWGLSVSAPDDVEIIVPSSIRLPRNGETTFDITIDARDVPLGEVRMGHITLRRGSQRLHIPVTIVRNEPSVGMTKVCDPAVFPLGGSTDCTITIQNNGFDDAFVGLEDQLPDPLELYPDSLDGATPSDNGFTWHGNLAGAGLPVITVADDGSPAGYLPLSSLGVDPLTGADDEVIFNFEGLPPSLYAGMEYTTIGMVSNGYLVMGGGDGDDIQFINQILPDPDPPNNVLANFWTDLNPGAGGGMRAAILTDGTNSWIVFDWEDVPNFADGEINDTQAWIGVNGVEDITYTYGPDISDGDAGLLTVGAEDSTGQSGANYYANGEGTPPTPTTEVRVASVPGEPGESHSITFSATGVQQGPWTNYAELTSDTFFGTSIVGFSGEVQ